MSRIGSVDTVRAAAALAVVIIHTSPFLGLAAPEQAEFGLAAIIKQMARFAVPCFFVLSGYFWAMKCARTGDYGAVSLGMIGRVLVIFVAWSLFYLVPSDFATVTGSSPLALAKQAWWNLLGLNIGRTLLSGTRNHLWFLSSLITCVVISALLLARGWSKLALGLAGAMYLFALIGGSYASTPIGIPLDFNTRLGPLSGLIFFLTGYLLQRAGPAPNRMQTGVVMLVVGTAISLFETWLLHTYFHTTVFPEFLVGTLFAGIGAALIALSGTAALDLPYLGRLGLVVLGIYAVHVFVIDLVAPLHAMWAPALSWQFGYPLLVFGLSALIALVLARIPVVRNVVA